MHRQQAKKEKKCQKMFVVRIMQLVSCVLNVLVLGRKITEGRIQNLNRVKSVANLDPCESLTSLDMNLLPIEFKSNPARSISVNGRS